MVCFHTSAFATEPVLQSAVIEVTIFVSTVVLKLCAHGGRRVSFDISHFVIFSVENI